MLDLSYTVRRLTQGRGAAEMTLVQRAEESPVQEAGADSQATARAAGQPADVDPHAVAERVYQLMRREIRTTRERRG